jgi:hypothetical protein
MGPDSLVLPQTEGRNSAALPAVPQGRLGLMVTDLFRIMYVFCYYQDNI